MDVDALLARAPDVALVDELAHTNAPGSPHAKRWQDVEELLDAGIDVISTVNVQHLESLNDVVEQITGVPSTRPCPTRWSGPPTRSSWSTCRRRRCGDGWRTATSTRAEKVDAALGNYFRAGNLTALRELALLWPADRVDEGLRAYLDATTASTALVGDPRARRRRRDRWSVSGESLIRRAARIADEVLLCGTGVQVSPVIEIDHRRIGSGEIGPIARLIRDRYFDAVRGRLAEYRHWLTPIDEGG